MPGGSRRYGEVEKTGRAALGGEIVPIHASTGCASRSSAASLRHSAARDSVNGCHCRPGVRFAKNLEEGNERLQASRAGIAIRSPFRLFGGTRSASRGSIEAIAPVPFESRVVLISDFRTSNVSAPIPVAAGSGLSEQTGCTESQGIYRAHRAPRAGGA